VKEVCNNYHNVDHSVAQVCKKYHNKKWLNLKLSLSTRKKGGTELFSSTRDFTCIHLYMPFLLLVLKCNALVEPAPTLVPW
jgi:hypothetical protein